MIINSFCIRTTLVGVLSFSVSHSTFAQIDASQSKVATLEQTKSRVLLIVPEQVGRLKLSSGQLSVTILRVSERGGEAQIGVRLKIFDGLRSEHGMAYIDADEAATVVAAIRDVVTLADQRRGNQTIKEPTDEVAIIRYMSKTGIDFFVYLSERNLYIRIAKATVYLNPEQTSQFLELMDTANGSIRNAP